MQRFRRPTLTALALIGTVTLGACAEQAPTAVELAGAPSFRRSSSPTGDYLILGAADALPDDLEASVAAAGGLLIRSYPELGLAVARATEAGFADRAARIGGVESVTEDRIVQLIDPNMRVVAADAVEQLATALDGGIVENDPFYPAQWAHLAVQTPSAWGAGYTGRGVRVAIIDGGLSDVHPDLQANVDVAASRSFVPPFPFNEDVGTFWHATHVAGIVAAVDNDIGVIGIAPHATLIGVKVLHAGTGSFNALIAGIFYAATPRPDGAGADVINMSLGLLIDDARDKAIRDQVRELSKAVDRATRYAHRQGVVVIAAAGNDTTNLDTLRTTLALPGQSQHVITIGATAPLGWATGADNFDRLASYSNTGRSLVDFSAPGGDDVLPGEASCIVPPFIGPCWLFDMYLSTNRGGYAWAKGTSAAGPVAAGIAALIIQKAGGRITPGEVEARMREGALDKGAPGTDAVYGQGWLNAFGSVRDAPITADELRADRQIESVRPGTARQK